MSSSVTIRARTDVARTVTLRLAGRTSAPACRWRMQLRRSRAIDDDAVAHEFDSDVGSIRIMAWNGAQQMLVLALLACAADTAGLYGGYWSDLEQIEGAAVDRHGEWRWDVLPAITRGALPPRRSYDDLAATPAMVDLAGAGAQTVLEVLQRGPSGPPPRTRWAANGKVLETQQPDGAWLSSDDLTGPSGTLTPEGLQASRAAIDAAAQVAQDAVARTAALDQIAADRLAVTTAADQVAQDAVARVATLQQIEHDAQARGIALEQIAADRGAAQQARTGAEAAQSAASSAYAAAAVEAGVAQAQASLAAGHAASTASVVQQDLSGVTASALHRSPNAITAMCIYDTSKDSDGGAWTEKRQHASWWTEAINGKWLGAQASEAAARTVSGATTGDYFQRTSDGKFFALSAGGGVTEVFRGNKRDFPRLAAMVAEATSVTIYDLTEPGRPMWMRFATVGTTYTTALNWASNTGAMTSLAAINGVIVFGSSGGSLIVDVAKDDMRALSNGAGRYLPRRRIADRQSTGAYVAAGGDGLQHAGNSVNAVAVAVLPDAPVDPATGLCVPTIAVATSGGVSVIRHAGAVETKTYASAACTSVAFDGLNLLVGGISPSAYWGAFVWNLRDGTVRDYGRFTHGGVVVSLNNNLSQPQVRRFGEKYAAIQGSGVSILRHNQAASARALLARISSTHTTGWLAGDLRRCFLSSMDVGTLARDVKTEDFSAYADSAALRSVWAQGSPMSASLVGGRMQISPAGGWVARSWPTTIGRAYKISVALTAGVSIIRLGSAVGAVNYGQFTNIATGTSTATFVATGPSFWVGVYADATQTNEYASFVLEEVVADRSHRASSASPFGSLTCSQVASGSSLVGHSGWSAANYAREPYSSDLDLGTGEWAASAWVLIPVVPVAGVIFDRSAASGPAIRLGITATGQLTASAFDGTNTRTVTTSAAYATATWINACVAYTVDGTLAIVVNGREAATTRGTPLLTLSNASAVLTIGNSLALDAPFPGSIALLKLGATVPSPEQAAFMYEQEKQLFRAGALSVLPDSGALVDMTYDDATDRWIAASATNASYWTGLVRNSVQPVAAGSFSRFAAGSGIELAARSTTAPGVDVTIPAYGLREELVRRAEAAARLSRDLTILDYVAGFTASTTIGSTAIANVTTLTYPGSVIGARVSGAGIPANSSIVGVSGTTIYLSAVCTATATSVLVSFLDFNLPGGMDAKAVMSSGALKQEGSTKDFTRLHDGFRETIRFAVAPGATAWVQIQAARGATQ